MSIKYFDSYEILAQLFVDKRKNKLNLCAILRNQRLKDKKDLQARVRVFTLAPLL